MSEGYEYTSAGQVSRAVDGNGNSVQYRYNSLGKVCERIDQSGYKETFQYDEEGNLSLHTDRDGKQVTRIYNVFGSLVYEKATDENGENPVITTCRYDSLGRLTHAVCDGHSYEYLYNEDGQLKEKRSGGRRLVSYAYDEAGQITELTDPAGVTTCYEYELLGRTSRIYSREGMEVKYTYDCLDRPERITYGNGLETAYLYDADSRVTYLETRHGEEVLLSFQYEYDGNGNRISKTGIQPGIAGTDYATAGNCALDVSYQYDIRGQLLEEKQNEEIFRYTYDAAGNRTKKEDREGITTYCYNEKNQLVSEEGLRGRNTFTYSRQGSILKKESQTGESRFFYNNKNQQIRVELEDGRVQENHYDGEGLRHEMKENGKLLRFVYHNRELLHEGYEGGDKEESSYHLGSGIKAVQRNQSIRYYHRDEQLSTVLMTDQNGKIQNHYCYDAFGNLLGSTEELLNRILYTGQQYDQATEQYYLRARYYTPALGRFLQEDVYQGDGLNLYVYCGNNPVAYCDPSGYKKTGDGCPPQGKMGDGSGENSEAEDKNSITKPKPNQVHHYATDKSKTFTQAFKDIANKYELDLDDDWNKELLPHQGRHPNAYHEFILDEMTNIDNKANGNKDVFLDLYESEIKRVIRENPDMLYSDYWKELNE